MKDLTSWDVWVLQIKEILAKLDFFFADIQSDQQGGMTRIFE
jgi:hypothetical protein